MKHVVEIPRFHPARLNALMRGHWRTKHRLKKSDKEIVGWYCREVPRAEGKRRVSLVVTLGPRQRAGDEDNWWKSLLDALVSCKALYDDSTAWLERGPIEFLKGAEPGLIVILEDVGRAE